MPLCAGHAGSFAASSPAQHPPLPALSVPLGAHGRLPSLHDRSYHRSVDVSISRSAFDFVGLLLSVSLLSHWFIYLSDLITLLF